MTLDPSNAECFVGEPWISVLNSSDCCKIDFSKQRYITLNASVASLVSHKSFHSGHFNASGILNCYKGDTRLGQILGK